VTPPGEFSQKAAGSPPSDALVLFDGTNLDGWIKRRDGTPAGWKVQDGYMEVVAKTGDIRSKLEFGDCQLHVEFATPAQVVGESQGRGNSGVFLMGRYEIQVLDCYQNLTYPDGTTGAIYGQYPPLVNACRPPGAWQTYDVIWASPRFDGHTLLAPARLTVLFNGLVIHHAQPLHGPTEHKITTGYHPHGPVGPLVLQDHGNPVRFRNIWYRPLRWYDE
jgi:hypothetical protein